MAELTGGEQGPADLDGGIDSRLMWVGSMQHGVEQSGREAQAGELCQRVRNGDR